MLIVALTENDPPGNSKNGSKKTYVSQAEEVQKYSLVHFLMNMEFIRFRKYS